MSRTKKAANPRAMSSGDNLACYTESVPGYDREFYLVDNDKGMMQVSVKRSFTRAISLANDLYDFVIELRKTIPRLPKRRIKPSAKVVNTITIAIATMRSRNISNFTSAHAETRPSAFQTKEQGRAEVSQLVLRKEARDYCDNQGLSDNLDVIWSLAKQNFRIVGDPSVTLEVDPEDGDVYILFYIKVIGSVDEVFDANERYIDQASGRFNPSILSRIRLLYKFAAPVQDIP